MKFGKKIFRIGFIVLLIGLAGIAFLRNSNPIKASSDNYKLELVKDKQPNQWILKLNIAETKDENLKLVYTGVDGIASETVLEGIEDDKAAESIELGAESIEEGYINFKTKKGLKSFEDNMSVSLLTVEKPKDGKVSLYSGEKLLAETTFEMPLEELPTEFEALETESMTDDGTSVVADTPVAPAAQTIAAFNSGIMPLADGVTVVVNSWTELVNEITSGTADVIELGQSIDASSAGPTITRSVKISGGANKYSLNMAARFFTLGSVSTATTITFDNIQLSSTGTTTPFLNATTANSNNWQVNFNNISLPTTNYKGLVSAANSKVSFTGVNDLNIIGGRTMITANGISITGELSFKAANASGTIQSADFFDNGQSNPIINVTDSNVTMQTNGSIFTSSGGSSSVTTAQFINSDIKSLHASTTNFLLESGKLLLTINNTPIEAAGFSTNFIRGTAGIESTITDSPITINGSVSYFMYANNQLKASHLNSPIYIAQLTNDGYRNNLTGGNIVFDNSPVTILNKSGSNYFIDLNQQGDVVFKNGSNIEYVASASTNGNFYNAVNNATGSSLTLNDITMNVNSGSGTAINVGSGDGDGSPDFDLTMSNTKATIVSASNEDGNTGGVISLTGLRSEFHIDNHSELNIYSNHANSTPAVMIMAAGGGFYITGQSKIYLESQGERNAYSATLRFRIKGDMTFDLDGQSTMEIQKNAGSVMAVRMYGGNNKFLVKGGSDVDIDNLAGSSGGSDGGAAASGLNGAQGILFTGTVAGSIDNTFEINGEDSSVSIVAENGPAIFGTSSYPTNIIAGDGTYFVARGKTASATAGIFFSGSTINADFGTMKYFDFTNTRTNGGSIFKSSGGVFTSNNTNLSLWKRVNGVNVYGNPTKSFIDVIYNLSGANLDTFISGTAELGTYLNSEGGIGSFTRMNGNNQQAIIDELRVPTDADKYVWGHASVPEGKGEENRDAFTDEVMVTVDILDSNDNVIYSGLTGTVVENVADTGTVSVYGEAERAGVFRIAIPDNKFLQSGYKIKVTAAWRGDPNSSLAHSTGDQIQTGEVTTIDVTPPTKAVSSTEMTNATKQISGTAEENGAKVFVKVNDEWLKDSSGNLITTTVVDNSWLINLPAYVDKTKNVDVYLKDNAAISPEPAYTLPTSYTQEPDGVYGNLNESPATYSAFAGYHDAVNNSDSGGADERFDEALRFVTADVLPDNPVLTKASASSGGTTTSVGDVVTYTITAKNDKSDVEAWKDVKIVDVIPEHLTFDETNHGIKIQGVELTDTSKFNYNPAIRTLTVSVGDLAANQSVSISFNVTVDSTAVDQEIFNTATAKGDSPQEDPFIPGPVDPTTTHKEITATSNEVGLPGGKTYGILQLLTAPNSIDFGVKTENVYGVTRFEDFEAKGMPLVVSDTRGNLGEWDLYVTVTSPLSNADGSLVLPTALKYKTDSSEEVLTGNAQKILTHTHTASGPYDVTQKEWVEKNNGFVFELPAGGLKSIESYSADILFTLSDTK